MTELKSAPSVGCCLQEGDYSAAELTEALLLIKVSGRAQEQGCLSVIQDLGPDSVSRPSTCELLPPQKQKAQKKMDFLTEVEESANSMRELKAAHAETIQELHKTRKILTMESRISKDYKVESSGCTCTHCSVRLSCLAVHCFISSVSGSVNALGLCFCRLPAGAGAAVEEDEQRPREVQGEAGTPGTAAGGTSSQNHQTGRWGSSLATSAYRSVSFDSTASFTCSAQLREVAYGVKRYPFQAEVPGEGWADEQSIHLEHGENLLELQIVGATLAPSALELLGECEPSTFCTYSFFRFEMHCTPVVMGPAPKYGFTSRYILNMDEDFLEYVHRCSVSVELHQKLLGCNWRTVAASRLPLRQLLEHDGKVQGTVPLVGR